MDSVTTELGTGATSIIPMQRRHNPGSTVDRERAPHGTLRSLPTSRNGRLERSLVEACTARKVWATSSGIRVRFLVISEVDCLGSAMEAAVMESTVGTISPRAHKGADP